jgi:hypothetical protein
VDAGFNEDIDIVTLHARLRQHGRRLVDTVTDGNCQFHAIAIQLPGQPSHVDVRRNVTEHLMNNYQRYNAGVTCEDYENMVTLLSQPGEWGDGYTLQAAADLYNLHIVVVCSDLKVEQPVFIDCYRSLNVVDAPYTIYLGYYYDKDYYRICADVDDQEAIITELQKLKIDKSAHVDKRMQDKIDCFSDTHRYMQQRMLEYIPQEKLQQSRGILSRLMYKLRLSDGRMAQYSADVIPGYICERYPQACVIAFHIVRGLSRYLEYGMPEQELFLARNWKTSNRAPKFSPSVHTFNAETQNFIQQQWKSIELNEKMFYILDMGSACAPELFGFLSAIQFLRSRSSTGSMNSIGADLIAVDRVAEWEPFLDISTKVMIELGFNIRMNFKVVDLRNPDGLCKV